MHIRKMEESEGTFTNSEKLETPCPSCKRKALTRKVWESKCGGYEDIKISCPCGYFYWIDGIDS